MSPERAWLDEGKIVSVNYNLIKAIWNHNLSIFITKHTTKPNTASDNGRECFCTRVENDEFMEIQEQQFLKERGSTGEGFKVG